MKNAKYTPLISGGAYILIRSPLLGNHGDVIRDEDSLSKLHRNGDFSQNCMPYRKRLKRYCHVSLLDSENLEATQEGKLSSASYKDYKLVYVHIVARHGDRTPAVALPQIGHQKVDYECYLSSKATKDVLWEGLNDFPPLVPIGSVRNGRLKLHPGSKYENVTCGTGDLTTQGYLQHYNLGSHMNKVYDHLITETDLKTELYVQSTDYRRTIRSAGAFLLGFIPNTSDIRKQVQIHVQPGDVNQAPPIPIPLTYQLCKTIRKMREKERIKRGYYVQEKDYRWMYDSVIKMFNLSLHPTIPWTEVFDQFVSRGCHSLRSHTVLPCTKHGTCIDCTLGKSMFEYADWSMTEKYPSNTSLVVMTPFIEHSLLHPMDKIISTDNKATSYKMMLTFTHDSMLLQLLKAIGIQVNREWMPYASRLSFELWRASVEDLNNKPQYIVRVVFNGRSVVPAWSHGENMVYSDWKRNTVPVTVWTYNKICEIL